MTSPKATAASSSLGERAMRSVILSMSHRRSLGRLATRMPITRSMVRRFISGETLEEAFPAIEKLRAAGMRTTVDVLGEAVTAEAEARAAAARYLVVLDQLAARGVEPNVSLKPTQMGLGVSPELARETVGSIVAKAAAMGGFVRIDMEDHPTTDATLALWRAVRPANALEGPIDGGPDVGIVIQAMLRRSEADIEMCVAEGARVRLCKGAYKEPSSVAFPDKPDVDASYERLMLRLIRAGRYPGLATHDERLIARATEVAKAEGIGAERFEFQMLYGIRRDLQEKLVAEGWRVRVYVPFGSQWYPYFMRRLAERPANVTFLLKNMWRDRGRK
jgi:proline dehydrogenase